MAKKTGVKTAELIPKGAEQLVSSEKTTWQNIKQKAIQLFGSLVMEKK